MSSEIRDKLDQAKDEVGNLRSAYSNTKQSYRHDQNFKDLMEVSASFLADEVEGVYSAMDDAVDEIERLDDALDEASSELEKLRTENEALQEQVESLGQQINDLHSEGWRI